MGIQALKYAKQRKKINMAKYFTLKELCASNTAKQFGISNSPSPIETKNLYQLMEVLDDIREKWGSPIKVTSGYRCPKLNKLVGGSATSVHKIGFAADLQPMNGEMDEFITFMLKWAKTASFDQLLLERSGVTRWVHIGLYNNDLGQRKQIKQMVV